MTPADDIKAKLDVTEVIREYMPIKRAGVNWTGLCPFHNEKSPSFIISPAKQIWHCFGCGKGGDMFSFVMEKEGVDFVEALKLLAPKAGIILKRQNPKLISERNRVLDVLDLAASYYHSSLMNSSEAKEAGAYVVGRGLDRQTVEEWQIGYSKDSWDDLINYIKSKGYNDLDIFKAGLSAQKQGTNQYFDRFRGRVMFPIKDVNSNVVGFTSRVLPQNEGKDRMGKYVNSPQTVVYDKSRVLFALDKAKMDIKKKDLVIIVEGQMDAITAHQFGYKNVIASSGTALTESQVELLDRYTDNIVFALDADNAGQAATDRAGSVINNFDVRTIEANDRFGRVKRYIDPSKSYKKNIKVVLLPSGKDPDDCIRNNSQEWEQALKDAKPLMQYYFDKTLAKLSLNNVDDKRSAVKILLPLVSRLTNVVDKDYWLKKLSQTVDVDVKFLTEAMKGIKPERINKVKVQEKEGDTSIRKSNREEMLSEVLLALIIKFPVYLRYILDYILPDQIAGEDNQLIYKNLILYYNKYTNNQVDNLDDFVMNYQEFKKWLSEQSDVNGKETGILDKLFILSEKDYTKCSQAEANLEIKKIIKILKISYITNRLKEVTKLIEQAENNANQINNQELNDLLQEFNNLTEEIRQNNN